MFEQNIINKITVLAAAAVYCFSLSAHASQRLHVTADGSTIYYLSNYNKNGSNTLYISHNYGYTFNKTIEAPEIYLTSIASLNHNNSTVYAGGFEESIKFNLDDMSAQRLSTIQHEFDSVDLQSIYISPDDKMILMGGDDSDGDNSWLLIGKKTDNIADYKWTSTYAGQCGSEKYGTLNINSVSASRNTIFLASTTFATGHSPGICISSDKGKTWNMAQNFPAPNSSAVYAAQNGNIVYASGFNNEENGSQLPQLYYSNDQGHTWIQTNFGEKYNYPFIVALDGSRDGNIIYIGAMHENKNYGGLWKGTKNNQQIIFSKITFPKITNYETTDLSSSANGQVVSAIECHITSKSNKQCTIWTSNDFGATWHAGENAIV